MTADDALVRIALVTGYLGAGKTTLLNHLLANDEDARIAVIVNDIGEVNIDAELIADGGFSQADNVIPLTNGCICCTLADDLAAQLASLAASGDFDYIAIEASGICEPMPIAYTISEFCTSAGEQGEGEGEGEGREPTRFGRQLALDNIIAVVDCARMVEEFSGGRSLLRDQIDEDDVESLLVQQLEFCSTVVLNKVDLVDAGQLEEVRAIVRSLQKDAVVLEARDGEVPVAELLNTGRFNFDDVYRSAAWLEMLAHAGHHHDEPETLEYGISTFMYERRQPFSVEAFAGFAEAWPDSVIRTKGFAWVDQYPDTCFILEQAGMQRKFVDNGPFAASLPADEREQVLARNPGIRDRWDASCGDRLTRLVFIGRNMDQASIEARLDACLTAWTPGE